GAGPAGMGQVERQAPRFLRQGHRQPHQQLLLMMGRRPERARSTSNPSSRTRERASASVEFALVLPLVLVMALALVQVGLLVKDQLVVAGSARAGAREAAVTTDDQQVRQATQNAAVGLDPARLDIEVARQGGAG